MVLIDAAGVEHAIEVRADGSVAADGQRVPLRRAADASFQVGEAGAAAWAVAAGDIRWVFIDGQVSTFRVRRRSERPKHASGYHGSLTAPMPATVVTVNVQPGDAIERGDVLLVLEAMKMELPVRAPAAGRVLSVNCRAGELVQPGVSLIDIEE